MKKLYIAARTQSAEDVAKLWDLLNEEYQPAFDWTPVKVIYPETSTENQAHAFECMEAARTADAFVMIDNNTFDNAFGAIFEFGAAAVSNVPCVIVAPLTRESIFMTLPNVRIVSDVSEVGRALADMSHSEN